LRGKYLAPGVHILRDTGGNLLGAEIWVDPKCDANDANCVTP
jgi:hypothetical protein